MLKRRSTTATGISHIDIERSANRITINIFTAKPGMIIGRGGADIEALKKDIEVFLGKPANLNIMKCPKPTRSWWPRTSLNGSEERISFRRAMKQSMQRAMKSGAKGMKCSVGGRLGGADIARTEHYHEGSIPLQTLRADIDYGFAEAKTVRPSGRPRCGSTRASVCPSPRKRRAQPLPPKGGK